MPFFSAIPAGNLLPTSVHAQRGCLITVLAIVLFACGIGHAASKRSPGQFIPVFSNGSESHTCFRIPAIVRTPDGTLLAFAEARQNSCADFGNVRIVMRSGHDEGKTWGGLETVAKNGNPQADNAAPVVDTLDPRYPHGRVFLVYSTGNAPESAVLQGKGARRVWYRTSVDDGATWSAPVDITASVKRPSWREYATGPGHALQLTEGPHAGRLIVAAYHSQGATVPDGGSYAANAFYTDDRGRTWHLGATVAAPGSNESTAAQTDDGTVVMNSRDQSGSHSRIVSVSKDGSEHWNATWVAHDLPDPECEGSMIAYTPSSGFRSRTVLLFSNAANRVDRRDLTVSVSLDGGRTWPRHTVISAGPAAYSDIVLLPKGHLGILWERGDDGGIVFLARAIEPLVGK